ncbi:MAG: NrfD/PsrC family molybdoenzyme membrane anchor subunit, partial [Bradyrhizobium sp.]
LWQGPHATIDLLAQAVIEGGAALWLITLITGGEPSTLAALGWTVAYASMAHLAILGIEHFVTPSPTLHHELAIRAIRFGAFRRVFWWGAIGLGSAAPILVVLGAMAGGLPAVGLALAALAALGGGLAWEYVWVEAGQAVPIS